MKIHAVLVLAALLLLASLVTESDGLTVSLPPGLRKRELEGKVWIVNRFFPLVIKPAIYNTHELTW